MSVLGEVRNHMRILPFGALVVFVHMGEGIPVDKRDLPFSALAERYYFIDLLLVPYLLLGLLVIPLFSPIAPVGLGLLSLAALF